MIRAMSRKLGLAATLALLPSIAPAAEPAAEPAAPAGQDPEARRLFNEMLKAYKALPAYADKGTFAIKLTIDGKAREETRPMALTFARPDKVALDAGAVRLAGDGKDLATTIIPSKKYMKGKGPDAIAPGLFAEGPLGAILRGGPAGPAAAHLLNASIILDLLVGDDPSAALLENTKALKLDPDAEGRRQGLQGTPPGAGPGPGPPPAGRPRDEAPRPHRDGRRAEGPGGEGPRSRPVRRQHRLVERPDLDRAPRPQSLLVRRAEGLYRGRPRRVRPEEEGRRREGGGP